jgi:hypothetical protein
MIAHAVALWLASGVGGLTPDDDKPDFRGPIQRHPFDQPGPLVPFPKDEAIHACHARSVHEIDVVRSLRMQPVPYRVEQVSDLVWRVSGRFKGRYAFEIVIECLVNSEQVFDFSLRQRVGD